MRTQLLRPKCKQNCTLSHTYTRKIMTCDYLRVPEPKAKKNGRTCVMWVCGMWEIRMAVVAGSISSPTTNRQFIIRQIQFFCFFSMELCRLPMATHRHIPPTLPPRIGNCVSASILQLNSFCCVDTRLHHSMLGAHQYFDMLISSRCHINDKWGWDRVWPNEFYCWAKLRILLHVVCVEKHLSLTAFRFISFSPSQSASWIYTSRMAW